mmetsp:Transcript_46654/g.117339  ORF Transcript_46654/g.117339 Transcript_46654/m.117339 type:complete len:681 (-) Transcript_46654:232-2274(-)
MSPIVTDSTCSAVFAGFGAPAELVFNSSVLGCSAAGGFMSGLIFALKPVIAGEDHGLKLLRISGAKGQYADWINGPYQRQENGNYIKLGTKDGCTLTLKKDDVNKVQWDLVMSTEEGSKVLMRSEVEEQKPPEFVDSWSICLEAVMEEVTSMAVDETASLETTSAGESGVQSTSPPKKTRGGFFAWRAQGRAEQRARAAEPQTPLPARRVSCFEKQELEIKVSMLSSDLEHEMMTQTNPDPVSGTEETVWFCGQMMSHGNSAHESYCRPQRGEQCPTCRNAQRAADRGNSMCDNHVLWNALTFSTLFAVVYCVLALPVAHITCIADEDALPLHFHDNGSPERIITFGVVLGIILPLAGMIIWDQAMKETYDATSTNVLAALHTVIQFVPFMGLLAGSVSCHSGLRYEYYAAESIALVLALPRMALANKEMAEGRYSIPFTKINDYRFKIFAFMMSVIESSDLFLDLCSAGKAFVCRYWRARWMFYFVIGGYVVQNYLVFLFLGPTYWFHAIIGVGPDCMVRMAHKKDAEQKGELLTPLAAAKAAVDQRRMMAYVRVVTLSRLITEHIPLIFLQWDFLSSVKHDSTLFSSALTHASLFFTLVCALRGTMNAIFVQGATTQRTVQETSAQQAHDSARELEGADPAKPLLPLTMSDGASEASHADGGRRLAPVPESMRAASDE